MAQRYFGFCKKAMWLPADIGQGHAADVGSNGYNITDNAYGLVNHP